MAASNPSNPPTYSWTPDIPATAAYEVHAKWTADSGHASNAEYVIQTPSGSDLVEVDQRSNGGSWQLLGSFTLEAGTGNSVILNADLADGLAIADAPASSCGGRMGVDLRAPW